MGFTVPLGSLRERWALPHLFTLTLRRAVCFLLHWPSRRLHKRPARVYRTLKIRYAASCPVEFGLSSTGKTSSDLLPL